MQRITKKSYTITFANNQYLCFEKSYNNIQEDAVKITLCLTTKDAEVAIGWFRCCHDSEIKAGNEIITMITDNYVAFWQTNNIAKATEIKTPLRRRFAPRVL